MTKKIFYILSLSLSLMLTSCNKLKENELKNMLGKDKQPSTAEAVATADKNPTFDNLMGAGLALSSAKQTESAITYFDRALTASPKNSLALNNLCAENNNLEKWDKSIGYCEQAIAISPEFQLAKNNLKLAQEKKVAQLKLIDELKTKANSASGKTRQTHLIDLGFEYYKMGQYDEAVSIWKNTPKSNDTLHVRTLNNLGSAYIILKKFDLAKASLEEAAKLEPQNNLVKNNLAWLKKESESVSK